MNSYAVIKVYQTQYCHSFSEGSVKHKRAQAKFSVIDHQHVFSDNTITQSCEILVSIPAHSVSPLSQTVVTCLSLLTC